MRNWLVSYPGGGFLVPARSDPQAVSTLENDWGPNPTSLESKPHGPTRKKYSACG